VTIWSSLIGENWASRLVPLTSAYLPESDTRSAYAIDLVTVMAKGMNFETFGIKAPKGPGQEMWELLRPRLAYAASFSTIATLVDDTNIVSPRNATYLFSELEKFRTGFGEFIVFSTKEKPVMSLSSIEAKLGRIIGEISTDLMLKMHKRANNPLLRVVAAQAEISGSLAYLQTMWPFVSSEDLKMMLNPLR